MDVQREEFLGRIARLEGGHDGRSGARRRRGRIGRANWFAPLAMLAVAVIGMKTLVHANVGPDSYEYRIALLAAGDRADRLGAWLLSADPVTRQLSAVLRALAD